MVQNKKRLPQNTTWIKSYGLLEVLTTDKQYDSNHLDFCAVSYCISVHMVLHLLYGLFACTEIQQRFTCDQLLVMWTVVLHLDLCDFVTHSSPCSSLRSQDTQLFCEDCYDSDMCHCADVTLRGLPCPPMAS